MDDLPLVGVRAIVDNYINFKQQITAVTDAMTGSGKAAQTAASSARSSGTGWIDLASKIYVAEKAVRVITEALKDAVAFGVRGAEFEGVARGFNTITAQAGLLANTLLTDLRVASQGTISDFDLMRLSNVALVGVTGDLAKSFGQNLPRLMEIADAQSRVTAQSIDQVFNSIVEGVKRSAPRMIESAGLTIDATQAQAQLAAQLGKTTADLTEEEKSQAILNATLAAGNAILAQTGAQQLTVAEQAAQTGATLQNMADQVSLALQPAFAGFLTLINEVLNALAALVQAALPYLSAFAQLIGDSLKQAGGQVHDFASQMNTGQIAHDFFTGGAHLMGELANGLKWGLANYILPAVTAVANAIADFLLAFSPPKKGPLHHILEGGRNLMLTYVTGILGGLDSVQEVASEVDEALGNIGRLSRPAIELRLAQLDAALKPFQDRVELVSAEFDALQEPAQKALEAVDRQMTGLLDALAHGDTGAAERIRLLDAQREALQGAFDAQQQLVDAAQIQLGLAQASQANERVALTIALARLPVQQRIAAAVSAGVSGAVGGGAGAAAKAPTAAGGKGGAVSVSTGAIPGLPQLNPVDFFGGQDAIDNAKQEMTDAFAGGFKEVEGQYNVASINMSNATNRIGAGLRNVSRKLTQPFDDLAKTITDKLNEISKSVTDWLNTLAISISGGLNDVLAKIVDWLGMVGEGITLAVATASQNITDWLNTTAASITDWLNSAAQWLLDPGYEGGLANIFFRIPTVLATALGDLWTWFDNTFGAPIRQWIGGEGGGGLPGIINDIANAFTALKDRVAAILKLLASVIWNAIVPPLVTAINSAIDFVNTAVNNLEGVLWAITSEFTHEPMPQRHQSIAPLPMPANPFAAAALGGTFSGGLLRVGERGEEFIASAAKLAVFPHEFVQAIDRLTMVLAQPAPMPVYAGSTVNHINNGINATFNGVEGGNDIMRRMALLRARR